MSILDELATEGGMRVLIAVGFDIAPLAKHWDTPTACIFAQASRVADAITDLRAARDSVHAITGDDGTLLFLDDFKDGAEQAGKAFDAARAEVAAQISQLEGMIRRWEQR